MTENDDQLVTGFLQKNKVEIPDNHFSKRVMRSLPGRERKWSVRLTLLGALCGVVLFFILGGARLLPDFLYSLLTSDMLALLKQTDPVQLLVVFIILATLGIKRICSID